MCSGMCPTDSRSTAANSRRRHGRCCPVEVLECSLPMCVESRLCSKNYIPFTPMSSPKAPIHACHKPESLNTPYQVVVFPRYSPSGSRPRPRRPTSGAIPSPTDATTARNTMNRDSRGHRHASVLGRANRLAVWNPAQLFPMAMGSAPALRAQRRKPMVTVGQHWRLPPPGRRRRCQSLQ